MRSRSVLPRRRRRVRHTVITACLVSMVLGLTGGTARAKPPSDPAGGAAAAAQAETAAIAQRASSELHT